MSFRPFPGCALFLFSAAGLLAATATPFPKPSPERAFPELKIYAENGQPWRQAREDWDTARQLVRADAGWREWLRAESASVDRWMTRHRDRVEWRCGWWHDFVSPKDGSHLDWTEQIPGEEIPYLHSASDPKVEITPKIMGGWVFTFRGTHASNIHRAARLYRIQGDKRYAAWAATQLDFYAQHYLEWDENRDGARLYWQTLDIATNLLHYANAVRLLGDYVTPERRTVWLEKFFRPQVDVLNRTRRTIHNIATWHCCAVMQVALVFGDDAMWRGALEREFGFRDQVARGITSDYLWYEQSFGYNSYVVRAVHGLFTLAGLYGRTDELANEMCATENLMLSPIYLRFPDGHAPNPADNAGSPLRVPDRGTLASVFRVFPTALGLQAAAEAKSWDTLLDPPARLNGDATSSSRRRGEDAPAADIPPLPAVVSRNLESSRMALLVADGWQVYLHYGQLTRSHAQAEALNFAAFFEDTDISHDPGTVGYGSPLHKEYYTRGLAHNVPLVNGEGSEPPQPGELLAYAPSRVSVRQPLYRKNAHAERTLAIVHGTLVDTTTIGTAAGAQRLGLAVNVQGRARLTPDFAAAENFAAKRPAAFKYWRNVRGASGRDHLSVDVAYGGRVVRLTFTAPGEFTLWHGSVPDVPPKRREAFYLELSAPTTRATFTTTFAPER